jgi:hypothetical protein
LRALSVQKAICSAGTGLWIRPEYMGSEWFHKIGSHHYIYIRIARDIVRRVLADAARFDALCPIHR